MAFGLPSARVCVGVLVHCRRDRDGDGVDDQRSLMGIARAGCLANVYIIAKPSAVRLPFGAPNKRRDIRGCRLMAKTNRARSRYLYRRIAVVAES